MVTWEENEDLKVSLLKSLDMVSADPKTVNYKTFRGRSRNYKKFFFDKLRTHLYEIFDLCVSTMGTTRYLCMTGCTG